MATVVNFIDTTLQAAAARSVNLPTAEIQLLPSAPMFRVATDGTVSPASITITATLVDIDAPVSFSCSGGTLSNVTAKSASLTAASMSGAGATVTASTMVNGQVYTRLLTISKLEDGAQAALAAVQAIADDNVLSKGEKPNVIQLWSAISDEHQGIANQADALNVSRTSYDAAFTALYNFIVAISPAYNDLTLDSNVAGATMRTKFGDYYLARQTLLNALVAKNKSIADAAAGTSTWAGTTGPGKPSDNASSDLVLVGRNVSLTGNTATKTAGTYGQWDADVYSADSFTGGAYASAVIGDTTSSTMFGLNSDPKTDSGFGTIDYAIYADSGAGNLIRVFESGSQVGTSYGTYVAGDVLAVVYDGSSVKYLKNGAIVYTSVSAASKVAGQVLFFDSAFAHNGGVLKNIRFGPLSSNNWVNIGGTGKPEDNATVGAPAGTKVGNTDASVVEAAANNAVPKPTGFTLTGTFSGTVTNSSTGIQTLTKQLSATASGAAGTVTYSWVINLVEGSGTYKISDTTAANPILSCTASNVATRISVTCTATDTTTGLSRVASGVVNMNFGAV